MTAIAYELPRSGLTGELAPPRSYMGSTTQNSPTKREQHGIRRDSKDGGNAIELGWLYAPSPLAGPQRVSSGVTSSTAGCRLTGDQWPSGNFWVSGAVLSGTAAFHLIFCFSGAEAQPSARGTGDPKHIEIISQLGAHRKDAQSESASEPYSSAVGKLIDRSLEAAKLTLEELAPLIGVTRRSLQNWRAGEPISARKERRLIDTTFALERIPGASGDEKRVTLFARRTGGLRVYDLLAEGRNSAAIELAGAASISSEPYAATAEVGFPLAVRLDQFHIPNSISEGSADLRLSRRTKR